ncbi:hypothetical protein C8Q72DRAFT_217647 [Fomitopsis betulina]|nr:hypothetical protein C8Q72DRAFT_217647 [Fomitopsis betulina]
MLVLDSSSTCDVCLEPYSETRPPHVINCGHAFCLRCLQLLTRQICPLCRRDFEPVHVRRLHTDKSDGRSATPPPSFDDELDEPSAHARDLHSKISSIVLEGATALDVKNTLEDVTEWLKGYPPKEFADLEAAYLLLRNYTELQRKATDRKANLVALQDESDELRQQLESALGNYQELKHNLYDQKARCEELERLRDEDRQRYKDAENELEEKYAELDSTWTGRYEVCLSECKRLAEQVRECERTHRDPPPAPPRYDPAMGGRTAPRPSPQQEDMIVVLERAEQRPEPNNTLKIDIGSEENMFHVSPVSPVAPTLAIPDTFRALSDEIPDSEDEGLRSRSAKPIPIKSSLHRSGSSRLKYEADSAARSVPRSLIDVHMASCSASPSVSTLHAALRDRRGEAGPSSQEGAISLTSRYIDCQDMTEEERQVRRRAALQEVLQDPTTKCSSASGAPSSIPRSPAPVIPPPPPTRTNTVRWASEAARAAERARTASGISHSLAQAPPSSPLATRTPSPTATYTSTTRPPSPMRSPVARIRSAQPMRPSSTDSLKSMKMPANASGITRTFLQGAHAQRVS